MVWQVSPVQNSEMVLYCRLMRLKNVVAVAEKTGIRRMLINVWHAPHGKTTRGPCVWPCDHWVRAQSHANPAHHQQRVSLGKMEITAGGWTFRNYLRRRSSHWKSKQVFLSRGKVLRNLLCCRNEALGEKRGVISEKKCISQSKISVVYVRRVQTWDGSRTATL